MEPKVTWVFFLEYFNYAQFHLECSTGEAQALKYSEHRQSYHKPEGKFFTGVSGDQMGTTPVMPLEVTNFQCLIIPGVSWVDKHNLSVCDSFHTSVCSEVAP